MQADNNRLRSKLAAQVFEAAKQQEEANSKQAEAQQLEHETKEMITLIRESGRRV